MGDNDLLSTLQGSDTRYPGCPPLTKWQKIALLVAFGPPCFAIWLCAMVMLCRVVTLFLGGA